jgi:hypothetical protein
MSNPEDKEKHLRRMGQKHNYVEKQRRLAQTYGIPVEEPHRYQKHAALNCGDPKCIMCSNPRRIWKEKTLKEKILDKIYYEYKKENFCERDL